MREVTTTDCLENHVFLVDESRLSSEISPRPRMRRWEDGRFLGMRIFFHSSVVNFGALGAVF
jgi:hypothetical protein